MTNHALFKHMHGENSGTYSKKCTNFHIFEFKLGFLFSLNLQKMMAKNIYETTQLHQFFK